MANKRNLKKGIHYLCGDIAAECLIAKNFVPGVDQGQLDDIIARVAALQAATLRRTSFSFEKAPHDYESREAFRKERSKYFSKAYAKLQEDFLKNVEELVKSLNAALPRLVEKEK